MNKILLTIATAFWFGPWSTPVESEIIYLDTDKEYLVEKFGDDYYRNKDMYYETTLDEMIRNPEKFTDAYVKVNGTVVYTEYNDNIMKTLNVWIAEEGTRDVAATFRVTEASYYMEYKNYFEGDEITVYGVNYDRLDQVWHQPKDGLTELLFEDVRMIDLH